MNASNLYYIDALDAFLTYGWVPEPGCSDAFKKPRKRKEPPIKKDWPEQNLVEVDLTTPRFEPRIFPFIGTLITNGEADFNTKFDAFQAIMEKPGVRVMGVVELGQQFGFYCTDWTELKRLTRIKGTSLVAVKLKLELTEAAFTGSATHTFPYTFPIVF